MIDISVWQFRLEYPEVAESLQTYHERYLAVSKFARRSWKDDNKEYTCDHAGCGAKFFQKRNLRRHERQKHGRAPGRLNFSSTYND